VRPRDGGERPRWKCPGSTNSPVLGETPWLSFYPGARFCANSHNIFNLPIFFPHPDGGHNFADPGGGRVRPGPIAEINPPACFARGTKAAKTRPAVPALMAPRPRPFFFCRKSKSIQRMAGTLAEAGYFQWGKSRSQVEVSSPAVLARAAL